MTQNMLAKNIRAKKLGVLIRDARLNSSKSVEDCATAIGTSVSIFTEYEFGDQSPSLPEIEILAYYLNVPIEHFWGWDTLSKGSRAPKSLDANKLLQIRQRMIGTLIRQARQQAMLSLEDLAAKVNLSPQALEALELGAEPVPFPLLETISARLNRSLRDFQDKSGPVGTWVAQQLVVQSLLEMPPELQNFVVKPINQPYLELAQRLSEMSVEKLRAVAEGLLEITL
jgi:transcriptional regulator with XRE-family HTH domain